MLPEPQVERERRMALARKLYCDTPTPVSEIADQLRVAVSTIGGWARREGWPGRGHMQPLDRGLGSWAGKACPGLALCPERKVEIARAWATASAQISEIERRRAALAAARDAAALPAPAGEDGERIARTLALLVRTLGELSALEEAASRPGRPKRANTLGGKTLGGKSLGAGAAADGSGDDQNFPRDVDGLRQELTQQLDGLRRGGAAAAVPDGSGAGGPAEPEA